MQCRLTAGRRLGIDDGTGTQQPHASVGMSTAGGIMQRSVAVVVAQIRVAAGDPFGESIGVVVESWMECVEYR